MLAALAYQQAGSIDQAYLALVRVLERAEQGLTVSNDLRSYALRLLDAFPASGDTDGTRPVLINHPIAQVPDRLTDRELEVLRLVTTGASNQAIAERLVVSLHTVKKHMTHVLAKLGTNSRTAAVVRAQERQLI